MRGSLLIFLVLFVVLRANTQALPPILTYTPEEYGGGSQNWSLSQDEEGFIYAANNLGLLRYDGERWTLFSSPNESILRSVKAVGDRVYTGSYMDFGYWSELGTGGRAYHSIANKIADKIRVDEQFWGITSFDQQLIFQSLSQLVLYDPGTDSTRVLSSKHGITKLFKVDGKLYITDGYHQLFQLEGGEIAGAMLVDSEQYPLIHLWQEEGSLFCQTVSDGAFVLEDGKWRSSERHAFLDGLGLYSATELRGGGMAFGTISNGLFVVNAAHELTYHVDQADGLANNTVLSLFEDRQSNIWSGTDNGISCTNQRSPIRKYKDESGRLGTVHTSTVYRDKLYLGSNQGLFVQDVEEKESPRLIPGTNAQVWSLYVHEGTLFCGHDRGTFVVEEDRARLLDGESGTWCFLPIPGHSDLLLRGGYTGLEVLERTATGWEVRNKINDFDVSARFIALNDQHELYVSHEYRGVYGLKLNDTYTGVNGQKLFSEPGKGKNIGLAAFNDEILCYSKEGIYRLKNYEDGFRQAPELTAAFQREEYTSGKMTVEGDRLWFFTGSGMSYLQLGTLSGELERRTIPVPAKLINSKLGYENVANLGGDTILVGTADGYLMLALSSIPVHHHEVHLVSLATAPAGQPGRALPLTGKPTLSFPEHNLAVRVAVPTYDRYVLALYQYRLVGRDDTWSPWQTSPEIILSELPAGSYTLEVRSLLGQEVSENLVRYSFVIKRPWYASYLALLLYFILAASGLYFLNRAYKRYYDRQQAIWHAENKRRLANQQRERELEVTRLNNERLREDVESKSREMALSTMNLVKKNELLQYIKDELQTKRDPSLSIKEVVKTIDENINEAETWTLFKEAFEAADRDFFNTIKTNHPQLSPNDLKLCAYLRLNLSSKEIAPMLNISTRSVEVKRYRLRKKMALEHEVGLTDYIMSL